MKCSRRCLSAFAALALLAGGLGGSAEAEETAMLMTITIGECQVSLLSEGPSQGQSSLLLGASPEAIRRYVPDGTFPMAANAFLIRTPEHVALVDTGYGRKLFANLNALGVRPEDVDTVLLTHMHGDHIGGLLRQDKPAFPNARILVAAPEAAYWRDAAVMNSLPEARQGNFRMAQRALDAYGGRVETFMPPRLDAPPLELVPGVRAVAAFGHTPGHTVYLLSSGNKGMLFWGDLTHAMVIQMPIPDVAMTFDIDPAAAVESRLKLLAYAADQSLPVAGAHVPLPGMGTLARDGNSAYLFTPFDPAQR